MNIRELIKRFNNRKNIVLTANTIILVFLVFTCFYLLNQQKSLKLQIADITNKTLMFQQDDYISLPLDELLTLEFDKEEITKAYKDSFDACENYSKDGSGSLYICQDEYFEKHQKSLNESYSKISNFCRKNVVQYARIDCIDKVLEALKNDQTSVNLDKEYILNY